MDKPLYRSMVADGDDPAAPQRVRVVRTDDRAVVTLDEPDRLNVLSAPLVRQLRRVLEDLAADSAVRAVVLTGADPGFSAGGDLRMMRAAVEQRYAAEGTADVWRWIRREFGGIARLIAGSDTIFVAALNGPAAGVGLAWALTCDLTIASDKAVIVPAFARLGLIPEVGTSWALTRRLGYQGALAYYLKGEHIDAETAQRLGLVHEVVAHEQLLATADEWCSRVAALPPHAVAMAKPLLRAAADAGWNDALTLEEFAEPTCFTTAAFADSVETMLSDGTRPR
ncbi:enoyl-CoA hydratase/isomerase family protein [Mycolicibacterium fortuitum]|uniref:Enoyl-CoA hydratase/carnithine racemase n=1 Tax=Mycolicibacterium fortuitum subsp. fortuitum DSM 46621 = ATCC 6841 = JCM 6387 TaxID=1214102 RepID=K0VPZ0_MYCFO|nr:enoyl-CoA hydratase/isomerase family protein [Mycolicibacterium fortuitum]AIY45766.1 Enoyl-CoA hydratase [Mycobacterium sp. VKM Ac-1817D]CRL80099.1 enoyl-CoA hydratase/carnithine racemase [Mycolicibacter nonchromogenicus]AMD54435.1 enoyl-CoA hydratase [Mycolicibacterium fortuitum subsp. fortuitum DSM 46621 = ATCC 6841 = JCM 6387]EJZ13369.1 enoyl-CoA hydratase/carnithine racemase [Mycolicibacterium fortuitum subsp. fortuitum DSM 46621 = ATCC 6841 = JCM 6387]MBP3085337.1 enoyl-CoA hydratase/i